MTNVSNEALLRKLKLRADEEGISEEFPPLSVEQVSRCEKQLGFKLPELVRLVYTTIANGGIGTDALLGLIGGLTDENDQDASTIYDEWIKDDSVREDFDDENRDVKLDWIPGVIPVCHLGCSMYTVLDCNVPEGRMVQCDLEAANGAFKKLWKKGGREVFQLPGTPFAEWIGSWVDESKQLDVAPGAAPSKEKETPPLAQDQHEGETNAEYVLRKAADSGDANAMYELAHAIWHRDAKKSSFWLLSAANMGHPDACYQLATDLRDGRSDVYDWERAFEYSSKANHPQSFYIGGKHFDVQHRSSQFWNAARDWWEKRAEQGDAQAAYSLGAAQENGYYNNPDKETALKSYTRAAELGHVKAQALIGAMLAPADDGIKWLIKAAAEDDVSAQFNLWRYYSLDDRNWKLALKYLKAAAKTRTVAAPVDSIYATITASTAAPIMDSINAMIDLAKEYLSGTHIEADPARAIKLLERASKPIGMAEPSRLLGLFYKNDPRGADPIKAASWFRHGSERHDVECFYQLGLMYEEGVGVRQDSSRACIILKIAADKGHLQAAERLKTVRKC
jgi:TPR repeat protein